MGKSFRETLNQQLQNKDFKDEYEALEPKFQIIREVLRSRREKNLTQKDLSQLTGIAQGDISRIENGKANPSISTLVRIANALGKELKITFEPLAASLEKASLKD